MARKNFSSLPSTCNPLVGSFSVLVKAAGSACDDVVPLLLSRNMFNYLLSCHVCYPV